MCSRRRAPDEGGNREAISRQLPEPALEDGHVLQTARTDLLERRRA